MKIKKQMSETLFIGVLLALVGGFLDAYTYLCRGHVFANAQTGNIVLLGIRFIEGNYLGFIYYLFPIFTFFIGILISEVIKSHYQYHNKIHWRQMILCIELLILIIVSFLPKDYNMLCNMMIAFVCSLQVQSFRKFNGNPYASTMCTGNLRSATEHFYQYIHNKNKDSLSKSLQYYMIILFFIIGACLGTYFTNILNIKATLISALFLFIVILFMFIKHER